MRSRAYDLIVLGGGSGGVATARRAAQLGVSVALVEPRPMGGTCVNRGCIPKKLYMYAGSYANHLKDSRGYGWTVPTPKHDWAKLKAAKDAEIARLNGIYEGMLERTGVKVYRSYGRLLQSGSVHLDDLNDEISGANTLVATGGRPWTPALPGIHLAETSDDVFEWDTLPTSVVIVGGGYIACEFASMLDSLGVAVTQVIRGDLLLRGFDYDLRTHIHEMMSDRFTLVTDTTVTSICQGNRALDVTLSNNSVITAERIVYATGRIPLIPRGIESLGIQITKNGHISVDEYSQTTAAGVYAIGDVTDRVALTPAAIVEARALVETLFKENRTPVFHDQIPTAVFTIPECASVGLIQPTSEPLDGITVHKSSFRPLKYTMTGSTDKMLMKLLVEDKSNKVVGCHIAGEGASEMIQCIAVAIQAGATKQHFDSTMALHPTSAEELVLMY